MLNNKPAFMRRGSHVHVRLPTYGIGLERIIFMAFARPAHNLLPSNVEVVGALLL